MGGAESKSDQELVMPREVRKREIKSCPPPQCARPTLPASLWSTMRAGEKVVGLR